MSDPPPAAAGVDGCRGGWIAVTRSRPDEAPVARMFPRFAFLLQWLGERAAIAVDMPIGLPERIEGPGRGAEKAIRRLLGERQSSVFSIPARAAVEAGAGPFRSELHRRETHAAACILAERLSHPPRRISIQGFGLFPKIVEIDRLLAAEPALAERVIESHPEFAFAVLNGGVPMALPKKIKSQVNPAGLEERRRLLVACGLPRAFLYAPPPTGAGQDDLLDACAMLLVAERHARGDARPNPDPAGARRTGSPDRDLGVKGRLEAAGKSYYDQKAVGSDAVSITMGSIPLPAAFPQRAGMHLLYLDDSGSVTNKSDRHIILAGLAVFERQPHWLSAKLDEIAGRVWPDEPSILEFRGADIAGGKRHWRGIGKDARTAAFKDALRVLGASQLVRLFGVAVHKASVSPEDPMEQAFEQSL